MKSFQDSPECVLKLRYSSVFMIYVLFILMGSLSISCFSIEEYFLIISAVVFNGLYKYSCHGDV